MAIDLSRLDISLDKFNAESSGTYNIGHLKLSSDGTSVYRTNNHKTFTLFNNTKISSEEAFAVKYAFCQALRKEGLDADQIAAVKEKLGISGGALGTLKAGSIKPLTAAEVREIIDVYAGQINRNRASAAREANIADVKALKTSKDLYNGVEMEEMADRAKTRDAINAGSLGKVMTGADKMVNGLLDMLQFGEQGESISPNAKRIANEIVRTMGNPKVLTAENKSYEMRSVPITFVLLDGGKIGAKIRLGSGNSFSIDTGLDKKSLMDKAAKVIDSTLPPAQPNVERTRAEDKKSADDPIMKAIDELESGEIVPESNDGANGNKYLLRELKNAFGQLNEANEHGDVEGRQFLRGKGNVRMELLIEKLQKALDKARELDVRNVQLLNQVREVFYGNKDIDTDYLYNCISDVLNKKPVDLADKLSKEIENRKNVPDDFAENLNINAWLGIDEGSEVDAKVEGFGQNAKKVRDAHSRMAERVDKQTGTTTVDRRNATILGVVNSTICEECKKMAKKDMTEEDWKEVTFFNDVTRQLDVMLPSGERLANDFEKARDQLAALATGKPKYSELTNKEKAKVHVLMAILTQRPSQGLIFSEGVALDPNDSTSKLFFGGEMGGGSIKFAYALSFAKDGSLNISCRATQENFSMMMLFGGTSDGEGTVPVMPGKGSKVDATMNLKIDMTELDRLAGIDFSKFDDKGVSEKYADKDLQHRYSDRMLLGEDFMLDDSKITCTSTYKLTVK